MFGKIINNFDIRFLLFCSLPTGIKSGTRIAIVDGKMWRSLRLEGFRGTR